MNNQFEFRMICAHLTRQYMTIITIQYKLFNVPYIANQRHGWSFLVVTLPSTSHHLLCVLIGSVCVRALICLVVIIAVHLGNEVVFTSYHRWHYRSQSIPVMPHWPFQVLPCRRLYRFEKWISETPPKVRREPVTSSIAHECDNHSATVNQRYLDEETFLGGLFL